MLSSRSVSLLLRMWILWEQETIFIITTKIIPWLLRRFLRFHTLRRQCWHIQIVSNLLRSHDIFTRGSIDILKVRIDWIFFIIRDKNRLCLDRIITRVVIQNIFPLWPLWHLFADMAHFTIVCWVVINFLLISFVLITNNVFLSECFFVMLDKTGLSCCSETIDHTFFGIEDFGEADVLSIVFELTLGGDHVDGVDGREFGL